MYDHGMHQLTVVELNYPGSFPKIPGMAHKSPEEAFADENARRVHHTFRLLERQLGDASISLWAYRNEQRRELLSSVLMRDRGDIMYQIWMRDGERRQATEERLRPLLDPDPARAYATVKRELERQDWEHGNLPQSWKQCFIFIYARAFIHATYFIGRGLRQLIEVEALAPRITLILDDYAARFPHIKSIRDSVAHVDERSLGEARGQKLELDPQKIGIEVLVLDSIVNDEFITTFADGTSGGCSITEESLRSLAMLVQRAIDSVNWFGPPTSWP